MMNAEEYGFEYSNRFEVSGKPKLCWTCIKKYEDGSMVLSKKKFRRIFFCKDGLEKQLK